MKKTNLKIIGTPKTRSVTIAYRPWILRPVDGSYCQWDGGCWPEWLASERKYADEVFADLDEALAWVESKLGKFVKRINTSTVRGFYGDKFIKGSAEIVRKGNALRVAAKYVAPRFFNGVEQGTTRKTETYARGGIKVVELTA